MVLREGGNQTGAGGHYTFGYVDPTAYKGSINYAPVNSSQGFWQVNSPYFKIGRNGPAIPRNGQVSSTSGASLSVTDQVRVANKMNTLGQPTQVNVLGSPDPKNKAKFSKLALPNHPVIVDTGTTLMLIDDASLLTLYNAVPGATYNQTAGYEN